MGNGSIKWEELENKVMQKSNENEYEEIEQMQEEVIPKKKNNRKIIIPVVIISIILLVLIIFSTIFSIININNNKIVSGVKIQGIDVSGLSKDEAKAKLESIYNEKKQKEILLKYNEYESTVTPELLEANFDIENVVEQAVLIGKNSNIITNNYNILFALMGKKNIDLNVTFNEELINNSIAEIQSNLPDAVSEAEYYIEEDKLIITKGKDGLKIDTEKLVEKIEENLLSNNTNVDYIVLPVINKVPDKIDIEKIYEEVHKEVKDAYYTKEPFTIYPEVEGVDFNLEEAKKILEEDKEKYEIQLTITKPNVTMSQIGTEAFPNLLGTYSTRYNGGDVNRTANLKIACQKINDKVVLPGEVFSYNKALGPRTAAAGYKDAKVYENGRVVDGIGGGICQISSTLYNAILLANMEATERANHMFVTSYTPAGRDATVVYGAIDFKFKNTRTYAIKIKASCSNGVATVSIYGIKEENEYSVSFSTETISTIPFTVKYEDDNTLEAGKEKVVQNGTNGQITQTYIIKSLNGKVVSTKLLSKDTYSAMQKIILRGTKSTTVDTSTNVTVPDYNENNPSVDIPVVDNPSVDSPSQENPPVDNPSVDEPTGGNEPEDNPSTDNQPVNDTTGGTQDDSSTTVDNTSVIVEI